MKASSAEYVLDTGLFGFIMEDDEDDEADEAMPSIPPCVEGQVIECREARLSDRMDRPEESN
jgi:hypothetical protein